MLSEQELRTNHDFVSAFERLRREHNVWDMHDAALRDIAGATGISFEALRTARHLRNAVAHDQPVNRDSLQKHLSILTGTDTDDPSPVRADIVSPSRAVPARSDIAKSVRAFRLHAWRNDELEASMLANGFVSVGGAEIGDLTNVDDPEQIRADLTRSMTERTANAINLFVGYWRRFLWEARVGDIVVLPTQSHGVALGTFTSTYFYVPTATEHARHRRQVDWRRVGLDRQDFSSDLNRLLSGRHTIQTAADSVVDELAVAIRLAD